MESREKNIGKRGWRFEKIIIKLNKNSLKRNSETLKWGWERKVKENRIREWNKKTQITERSL